MNMPIEDWPVLDLFSGSGGMSLGFRRRKPFRIVAAVDAEESKPCEGSGKLDCNSTYSLNIGLPPIAADLGTTSPEQLLEHVNSRSAQPLRPGDLTVLICCPPCTDFSRAKPTNHQTDSLKNLLVGRCAAFVSSLLPEFVVMENARELITGHNGHHLRAFKSSLTKLGYDVFSKVYMLTRFGLPQVRERAVLIASRLGPVKTLDDLWEGWRVQDDAVTVRHAIGYLNARPLEPGSVDSIDSMHQSPGFASDLVRRRICAIPKDGGSWFDIARHKEAAELLTNSMKHRLQRRDLGSHPDVYGRLAWNRPSITIKRECAHVGNGRYVHPEQNRLLTVREMALLQGFPRDYVFYCKSLANRYRLVGDAVPPIVSYQLSALVAWMKSGQRPSPADWVLPGTCLKSDDLLPDLPLLQLMQS